VQNSIKLILTGVALAIFMAIAPAQALVYGPSLLGYPERIKSLSPGLTRSAGLPWIFVLGVPNSERVEAKPALTGTPPSEPPKKNAS